MKTHTIESRLRDIEAAVMTATELTAVWKANQVPLSAVGNQVWVQLDGVMVLARVAVDENGVFLERVLKSQNENLQ
jgi:hypothetical protein